MAKSKFQNLTVDLQDLRRMSVTDRLDFLRSSDGISILPKFTPSQLNDLFPWHYRRSFTDIGSAMKAVSERRNVDGGVSSSSAEPVPSSGMSPRGSTRRTPVSSSWQDRLRERTGVSINEPSHGPAMERLKREISRGEGDYNSVNRGRAGDTPGGAERLLGRPLSELTVGEIMDMQSGGAGQRKLFAVGKYQFIPNTLSEAVRYTGVDRNARFDAATQEKLFEYTISEKKRPSLSAYLSGRSNDRESALRDLSLEYASVPGPGGRGAYDRDRAGNMAYGGRERAERMLQILSEAREERMIGQTQQIQTDVQPPQLPNGLAPKLIEELGRMTPRQQQKFMTALEKIGGVERMNELYQQSPTIVDRAAAQGSSFSYTNVSFKSDRDRAGVSQLSQETQSLLQRLDATGVPITVTSTFRSPEQNARTRGSSATSLHMSGNAIDIRTNNKSPEELQKTVQALKRAGFNKVLLENDHLHAEFHPGSNDFNVSLRRGHNNPNISLDQARTAAETVAFREQALEQQMAERASTSTLRTPDAPAGPTRQVVQVETPPAQPSETLPSLPSFATGGKLDTDAQNLKAYAVDKGKLQRDNMLVTDGKQPLFTMNSNEEMKFNPDSGKVSVNPSHRGLKADPNTLQEKLEPIVQPTEQMANNNSEEKQVRETVVQPVVIQPATSSSPTVNSYDVILNRSLEKMSPSFERAIARTRFANTGDTALGGHFDWGASNMS
jgi:uncharacterized protein YcbK (DUF882 family)